MPTPRPNEFRSEVASIPARELAKLRKKLPRWDPVHRELWLGRYLVKRFRRPAANQILIIVAFQEQNWQEHVDDPLSGKSGMNAKKRLHDTIKQLNRNQVNPLLHSYNRLSIFFESSVT
jgi:hypothetical protein